MTNWYKFTEHNDNEGETWHFFIQLTEEERGHLHDLLEDHELEHYSISKTHLPEAEVDVLVKHSDSGYMDTYNKCPSPYPIEVMELPASPEDLDSMFYKGGFW